jgi:hypothetical protein
MGWLFGRKKKEPQVPFPEPVGKPLPPPMEEPNPVPMEVSTPHTGSPFFLKVGSYRQVLGELDSLKNNLAKLTDLNTKIHGSEYNEETRFTKLRRDVRNIHDNLLTVDKRLFKR